MHFLHDLYVSSGSLLLSSFQSKKKQKKKKKNMSLVQPVVVTEFIPEQKKTCL